MYKREVYLTFCYFKLIRERYMTYTYLIILKREEKSMCNEMKKG